MLEDSQAAVQFIDKLIDEKEMQNLDEEIRLQLRADLLRRLEDRISRNIVNALDGPKLAQFEHLIDTNQIDKIQEFLYKEGINIHEVVARSMSEFQASYLET